MQPGCTRLLESGNALLHARVRPGHAAFRLIRPVGRARSTRPMHPRLAQRCNVKPANAGSLSARSTHCSVIALACCRIAGCDVEGLVINGIRVGALLRLFLLQEQHYGH
jgi:hypothetical protein